MPVYKGELKRIVNGDFEPLYYYEWQRYFDKALDDNHRAALVIAFFTGIRPIEAYRLKKEDFVVKGAWLRIRVRTAKKGVPRVLLLPRRVREVSWLVEHVKKLVFPLESPYPRYYAKRNFRAVFQNDNERAGILDSTGRPYSWYFFRHNIITLLAENGAEFLDLLIFKGARLPKGLFGSVAPYLHHSEARLKKIGRILLKVTKQ